MVLPSPILSIFLLICLILLNAFFAMSEIAIVSTNVNKMKKMSNSGNKKAKLFLKITESPSIFLATIQLGITLSGFLASAVAADNFSKILVSKLLFLDINKSLLQAICLITITIILSYFMLIFGELIPKRIAIEYSEKISLNVIKFLWFFYKCVGPFVKFLSFTTNKILSIFGIKPQKDNKVTEEDILNLVDASEETGVLEEKGIDMIKNIFEFEDKNISEIMTHRTSIFAIKDNLSINEFLKIVENEGYSRIPIYKENLDNIVGIVYVKDLIPIFNKDLDKLSILDYSRPPIYFPETTKCTKLLKEFQEKKIHMAVVIDEYGGTSGLITMEDLLEIIVGNIQDEYDEETSKSKVLSENKYIVDGTMPLDKIEELFKEEIFDKKDFETINGFLIDFIGKIPSGKETFSIKKTNSEYIFSILEVDRKKILKVQIEKKLLNKN